MPPNATHNADQVREKLEELRFQVESALRPERRYTVNDALDNLPNPAIGPVSARRALACGKATLAGLTGSTD